MVEEIDGKSPVMGRGVFLAPTAVVIGDVEIGQGSSVWYNAVIRADRAAIRIGVNTNIQDNCTVHADPPYPVTIGDHVSIGHNAVVHGATLEDGCLIGIGAIILNGAVVKTGSIVAPGAVVRQGQVVGPHHLVAGVPATMKRVVDPEEAARNIENAQTYVDLAGRYAKRAG